MELQQKLVEQPHWPLPPPHRYPATSADLQRSTWAVLTPTPHSFQLHLPDCRSRAKEVLLHLATGDRFLPESAMVQIHGIAATPGFQSQVKDGAAGSTGNLVSPRHRKGFEILQHKSYNRRAAPRHSSFPASPYCEFTGWTLLQTSCFSHPIKSSSRNSI